MSMFSDVWDKLKETVIKQSVEKGVKRVVSLAVSYVAAMNLRKYGVTVDETALTAAIFGLIETGKDYIKHKFNVQWL